MLTHPLLDKLYHLHCHGMLEALQEQLQQTDLQTVSFEERLSWLIEKEWWHRENRRMKSRLKIAGLRQNASMEDINYQTARGLSKSVMQALSHCQWVRAQQNIILTGSTGTGKSFLACALGHKACLEGFSVRYVRMPRLVQELNLSHGDGSYIKKIHQLAKVKVLIIDDWGLSAMDSSSRRDLLEILEERYERGSTIVTSQLPIVHWHEFIGEATLADAILDRLIHNAHKIELQGESIRKEKIASKPLTNGGVF